MTSDQLYIYSLRLMDDPDPPTSCEGEDQTGVSKRTGGRYKSLGAPRSSARFRSFTAGDELQRPSSFGIRTSTAPLQVLPPMVHRLQMFVCIYAPTIHTFQKSSLFVKTDALALEQLLRSLSAPPFLPFHEVSPKHRV